MNGRIGPFHYESSWEWLAIVALFSQLLGVLALLVLLILSYAPRVDLIRYEWSPPIRIQLINGWFRQEVHSHNEPPIATQADDWSIDLFVAGVCYVGTYQYPGSIRIHGINYYIFEFSIWFALLLNLVPIPFLARLIAKRELRRRRGACVRCGFDLRASKEKCPECGREVAMS